MSKFFLVSFLMILSINCVAQTGGLIVEDNEFTVDKKVVAKVKNVKQGFLLGRQIRLLGASEEILVTVDTKTYQVPGKIEFINYCHFYIPQLKDSIQVYMDTVATELGKKIGGFGGHSISEKDWAAYFLKKNFVTANGTLNTDAVKILKEQHPIGVVALYNNKMAEVNKCDKAVKTPTTRNFYVPAKVTETGRETAGNIVTIKYQVEHDGKMIGTIVGKGSAAIVANERAEIEFKPKLFGKQSEVPMSFDILSPEGCSVAHYNPQDKKLYTVRADKGGWHGIMSPILDKKADTVKTRIEIVSAMVDYLIQLTYY